jgi:hypothetical protein
LQVAKYLASVLGQEIDRPGLRARFNAIARPLGIHLDEPDRLFAALTAQRTALQAWKEVARRGDEELKSVLVPYLRQPPDVLLGWIATSDADLQMVQEGRGAIWRVMRKIADEPDVAGWLSATLDHGLGSHAGPLIEETVRRNAVDPEMATSLMSEPACRPAFVGAVMRHDVDEQLLGIAFEQVTVDDLRGIDISVAVRHAAESRLRLLLTHRDADVRGTGAALWAAAVSQDPIEGVNELSPHPLWLEAIADFKVPSVLEDYDQREALKFTARVVPSAYIDLLASHARAVVKHDDFDEWSESIRELSPEHRHDLWTRVGATCNARELFWALAAGSVEWVASAFEREVVPIDLDRLLHAWRCQNGPGIPFEELARLFMALGVEPDGLLWLLDVGTYVGEEHERYADQLERCRALASSPNPDLARLGARGVELYEPRLVEARQRARDAAVRGLLV